MASFYQITAQESNDENRTNVTEKKDGNKNEAEWNFSQHCRHSADSGGVKLLLTMKSCSIFSFFVFMGLESLKSDLTIFLSGFNALNKILYF